MVSTTHYVLMVHGHQYVGPVMRQNRFNLLFVRNWSFIICLIILSNILNSSTLCSSSSRKSRFVWHFFELVIDVFSFLPEFLHVFHHSATALLCYTQLNGRTSIVRFQQIYFLLRWLSYILTVMGRDCSKSGSSRCYVWVVINIWQAVSDVLLDYYYYATAGGAKFWVWHWQFTNKKFITDCTTIVEEVSHNYANCAVRYWPRSCLFRQ